MIDLTEASIIPSPPGSILKANDINAIRSFVSEVFTYFPSDQHSNLANEALEKILQKLSVDENQTLNRRVLEEALIVLRQY
jgi:hypothetical protein